VGVYGKGLASHHSKGFGLDSIRVSYDLAFAQGSWVGPRRGRKQGEGGGGALGTSGGDEKRDGGG
jgi:hypothetical protein